MRKENIIMDKKIEVGIGKEAFNEINLEELKMAHPELSFVPIDEANIEARSTFFITKAPLPEYPFSLSVESIKDAIVLWDYKRRIMAYTWFKSIPLVDLKDLYEAWYILKFLCQEIYNTKARKLGKEMAELKVHTGREELKKYKEEILSILERPSNSSRIRCSLWKNYSNQLKKTKKPISAIKTPEDSTGEDTLLEELKILEKEALLTNLFFGTSPILYKNPNN